MINTEYKIRPPEPAEIISTFGSLRFAKIVAKNDQITMLHYIHNRTLVPVDEQKQRVIKAWSAAPQHGKNRRRYFTEIAELAHVDRRMAKTLLIEAGLVPGS